MSEFLVNILQTNLHHSRSASVILISFMTVRNTCPVIALVQELWVIRNRSKGLTVPGITYFSGGQ